MGLIRWLRNHWKLVSAVALAFVAAVTVFFLVIFFPPALPFIAGLSAFGFAPFAGLLTIPLYAAAVASAALAAVATLMASTVFNILVLCSNILNTAIKPKERSVIDELGELSSDDFDGSYSGLNNSMGSKPKKSCCNPFSKSSKDEEDLHFDSPFSSSDGKAKSATPVPSFHSSAPAA